MPLLKLSPLDSEPLRLFGSMVPFLKTPLMLSLGKDLLYLFSKLSFDINPIPDTLPSFPKIELSLLLESLEADPGVLIFTVDHLGLKSVY